MHTRSGQTPVCHGESFRLLWFDRRWRRTSPPLRAFSPPLAWIARLYTDAEVWWSKAVLSSFFFFFLHQPLLSHPGDSGISSAPAHNCLSVVPFHHSITQCHLLLALLRVSTLVVPIWHSGHLPLWPPCNSISSSLSLLDQDVRRLHNSQLHPCQFSCC